MKILRCLFPVLLAALSGRAMAGVTVTDTANVTLALTQVEADGDTTPNPNVTRVLGGVPVPYTETGTNAYNCCGGRAGTYGIHNLNDGDIGAANSDGTYALPTSGPGAVVITFTGGVTTLTGVAIYNGYGNRDDGNYTLKDGAGNVLGAWTIAGTIGGTNAGMDSFWFTFKTPVTTNRLVIDTAMTTDNNTPSFREIQVFAPGTGPGNVGTVDGVSALELWVQPETLGQANGAAIQNWTDSSGNVRHFTQGNATLAPVLAAAAVNALPAARFTADWFDSLTLPSLNNEFTLVALVKPAVTGAYHNIMDDEDGGRPMLWVDGAGNYEFSLNTGAVAPASGGWDVVFAVKRTTGPQFTQLYLNGPAVTSGSGSNYTVAASEVYDFFNRDGGQAFTGDVAELMVFSTALTAAEINRVGYYLQWKYALGTNFPSPFAVFTGYAVSPALYGAGAAVAPNAPVLAGGVPTGFSVAPPLPAGLALHTTTGVISGTPTAVTAATSYTVTATVAGQANISTQLSLQVTPPTLLGYTRSPAIFTRGVAGAPSAPVLRGAAASGYTMAPPLPAGLLLHAGTGVISGTPTVAAAAASYTVTASFSGYPDSSFALTVEVLVPALTLDITEFLAANDTGLTDGDGARSDWIEIHNYGATTIDLQGWSLTDAEGNPHKWTFPAPRLLAPGAYLVVFASNDAHTDPSGYLHTNFRLDADGEYLALVAPDGTVVRAFAPAFPPQTADVSWGTSDRITYGAYAAPTPGAANGFPNTVTARVTAAPAGRTFAGSVNVALSAPLPAGAEIRYTLNNTLPTAASPLFSTPLSLTNTTRLRARVFLAGQNPGPELSETYLRLGTGVETFSSNLPLVFLHTDGGIAGGNSATLTGASAVIVDVDAGTGRASATGSVNYSGRSGLRLRGRSSQSFPQKQYKFETRDDAGRETDAPLLGMNAGSDWVLYAPYTDKSLVRNALAYQMWALLGRTSLQTRFVEVFLNDDSDAQFSYADDYAGIYMLVESPRLDRLGLERPQTTGITGGYLMEMGNADEQNFSSAGSGRGVAHRFTDRGAEDLTAAQETWLRDYVGSFESALYGAGFVHPGTGQPWRELSDSAAHADYRIAREWSRNFDGGSTFYDLPRDGKLTMGPLWDYNWAFGNVNYAEGGDLPGYRTDGWNRSFTANVNGWSPWWLRMEQDADWWQEFIDRWTTLREGTLASAAVNVQVDALTQPLAAEATGRHFTRWPQLGQFTVISPPGWETRTTYQSEVDYLKIWTQQRSAWMDSQFPPRPAFSPAPGGVSAGSSVTLTAAAGQTIHYTLTGADPRLPGGAVNPAALSVSSGGSVTINTSAIVTARAKNGTVWGAPRTGAYVTGTLPAASTLVVSEIHYHPSNPTAAELTSDPLLNDDDFEFIELRNVGASALDLTGAHFTEGVQFTFPAGTVLAAGAHLVVVEHLAAFTLRYGAGATIAGQYTGNLDNDADTVVLLSADGAELIRLRYDDDWTSAADGAGYSLTLRNPAAPPADGSSPAAWGLSAAAGGSPGSANGPVFTEDFTLWRLSTISAADLADPARSGPLADPDSDNYDNLTEFALLSHPLDAASSPQIAGIVNGPNVEFTLTRPRQTFGLTWNIESSGKLTGWTPSGTAASVLSQTDLSETIKLSTPHGGSARQFWRISVTLSGAP